MIRDLLAMGESRLAAAGCENPRGDAEAIFHFMNQVDAAYVFTHYSMELDDDRCEYYFEFIDERCSRKPLQYMLGKCEFMGLPFKVNENVLVPRQDSETVAERALELLKARHAGFGGLQVLDLCTGSGALAVSICRLAGQKIRMTAADLSPEALAVAQENARLNHVDGSIRFLQGDLFAPLPLDRKGRGKTSFDLIVSNPPYIPSAVIEMLQPEVRDYEPRMALDGGADGLGFYRRIAAEAPAHLKDDGLLVLEIGCEQGAPLRELLEAQGFGEIEVQKDLAGLDRCVSARLRK
jgi:release factor glutamine methyltransferase